MFQIVQPADGTRNSKEVGIGVLHPRMLTVYTLEAVGGTGESASYFKLNKRFQHRLGIDGEHFTAYNMVTGPFGSSYGRDHFCVQSMDGRLQFFEQDSYAFTQQFTNCLIPGPLCYASQIDAIITATSDLHIECYKYQVLATAVCSQAGEDKEDQVSAGLTNKKQLYADWRTNVGEHVLDIQVARFSQTLTPAQFDIIVLCKLRKINPNPNIICNR